MDTINFGKIKEDAKAKIKGNVFILFVGNLIAGVLLGPINTLLGLGQLIMIALTVVIFGLCRFYLTYIDEGKTEFIELFYSFRVKDINTYFLHLGTVIVRYIIIFLWALLLIIPGIIKAIQYSQSSYIRAEKPEQGIMDCLRESERLMTGHKMEFFLLNLSFIGWYLLSLLTFGILLIYVIPYHSTTMALYYRHLRPKAEGTEPVIE